MNVKMMLNETAKSILKGEKQGILNLGWANHNVYIFIVCNTYKSILFFSIVKQCLRIGNKEN